MLEIQDAPPGMWIIKSTNENNKIYYKIISNYIIVSIIILTNTIISLKLKNGNGSEFLHLILLSSPMPLLQ